MERYHRVHRKMLETIAELQGWMEELLRGASGPAALAELMRSLGLDGSILFDTSGLSPGTASGFDPYRVLGLERTATDEEIKKRYRELLHRLHPDVAGVKGTEFLLGLVMAAYREIARERKWQP